MELARNHNVLLILASVWKIKTIPNKEKKVQEQTFIGHVLKREVVCLWAVAFPKDSIF